MTTQDDECVHGMHAAAMRMMVVSPVEEHRKVYGTHTKAIVGGTAHTQPFSLERVL